MRRIGVAIVVLVIAGGCSLSGDEAATTTAPPVATTAPPVETTAGLTFDGVAEALDEPIPAETAPPSQDPVVAPNPTTEPPERELISRYQRLFDPRPAEADADFVNSLIQDGVELEFRAEEVTDSSGRSYMAVVPRAWRYWPEGVPGGRDRAVWSTMGVDLDGSVEYQVGWMCQGACKPRKWQHEVINDEELTPLQPRFDGEELVIDRRIANPAGKTAVFQDPRRRDTARVMTVRWDNDASWLFVCEVELAYNAIDLLEVIIAACEQTVPLWVEEEPP